MWPHPWAEGTVRCQITFREGKGPVVDGRREASTFANRAWLTASTPEQAGRRARVVAIGAAGLAIGWAAAILLFDPIQFVLFTPKTKTGFELSLAFLRLFVALVLALFPDDLVRERLRWVAVGFLILGLGSLIFGYLIPVVDLATDFNTVLYGSLVTRSLGMVAMAVGLWPGVSLPCSRRAVAGAVGAFATLCLIVVACHRWLPALTHAEDVEAAASGDAFFHGMTAWHWGLSLLPLAAATAAAIGAVRHLAGQQLSDWLVAAMVLAAGAQLHIAFWPSAFSSILTTASFMRLGFTVIVAIGVVLELRRVAAERADLLAAERATGARLADLARLRADFTSMVAHELATPLAAVRRSAELAATDPLTPVQDRALATIVSEVDVLDSLVADVQAAGGVERDEFTLQPCSVPLLHVLADAVSFANSLPGGHPVNCSLAVREHVWVDPDRIAQVLHNLLSNAVKYSPPGSPIAVRTDRRGERIRIEVADRGPGIRPEDQERIFEKYGRVGGHRSQIPGLGLGLYVSRRIVRAHGDDLRVESTPGEGAIFWFELEVVP